MYKAESKRERAGGAPGGFGGTKTGYHGEQTEWMKAGTKSRRSGRFRELPGAKTPARFAVLPLGCVEIRAQILKRAAFERCIIYSRLSLTKTVGESWYPES